MFEHIATTYFPSGEISGAVKLNSPRDNFVTLLPSLSRVSLYISLRTDASLLAVKLIVELSSSILIILIPQFIPSVSLSKTEPSYD